MFAKFREDATKKELKAPSPGTTKASMREDATEKELKVSEVKAVIIPYIEYARLIIKLNYLSV